MRKQAVVRFLAATILPLSIVIPLQALPAQDSTGRPAAERVLDEARAKLASGNSAAALAALDRARTTCRQSKDVACLVQTELLASSAYQARGELARAERHAQRARTLAAGKDPTLEAQAIIKLAAIAADRGDARGAERLLETALPLAERAGDARTLGVLLELSGRNARALGRHADSAALHARAIEAASRAGDLRTTIRAYGARSTTLLGLGKFDEALDNAQRAYEHARDVPDLGLKASAVFGLAQVNAHIWNLDRAAELWTEAIEAYRKAGLALGVALATKQRMDTWNALGDYDRAAVDGRATLTLFEQSGSAGTSAEVFARLALIEANRGDEPTALAYAGRAEQALSGTLEGRQMYSRNDLGLMALKLKRPAEAESRFRRVLELAGKLGDAEYLWRGHYGLGLTALERGQPSAAQTELERAIVLIERMRRALPEAGLRASFMSERVKPYEALVQALQAQARTADDRFARRALEVAEQGRARALADLLAESRAGLSDSRVAAVRAEEARFTETFSRLQRELLATDDAARRPQLERQFADAELEYEALVVRLRRENPAYAELAHPRPPSADEMLALLGKDETLVEFSIGETSGFGWVLHAGSIHSYAVPGERTLAPQVRLLHAVVGADDLPQVKQIGSDLYEQLLGPASHLLRGAKRIVIVPDGPLRRIPFALLRVGGEAGSWLVERHAISVVPSAGVLSELRRTGRARATQAVLALAGVDATPASRALSEELRSSAGALPFAAEEARDVARVLGGERAGARAEVAATESTIKRAALDRYRVLHFAAHGVIDDVVPRRSAVLLGTDEREDGLLQLNEIANLRVGADLVVLATCRSHVGRNVRGEGLLSLSRAFMHAGARTVAATLWPVSDRDTRTLMTAFYRALARGAAPDAALQAAQIEMIDARGRQALPSRWAAFVVSGDATYPPFGERRRGPATYVVAVAAILGAAIAAVVILRRSRLFRTP